MKTLEVGHNYGDIFGLNKEAGQKMIYNGGISWTAEQIVNGEVKTMTSDSEATTKKATDYINQRVVNMGKY